MHILCMDNTVEFEENIWMLKKDTPIFLRAYLEQLLLAIILLTSNIEMW